MLKITKSTEPLVISTIVTCIYGPPGVGKTSLASSANAPLLLDFDAGAHRSQFRKDVVRADSWAQIASMTPEDLAPYKTLIVDTVGRCLDLLSAHIISGNPKMATSGGALSMAGWGQLKVGFATWLKYVRSFGIDVIFVAHSDEKPQGDSMIERIDAQGSSKMEIYKCADLMGRIFLSASGRVFNCNPTDTAFGKNPASLPVLEVPDLSGAPDFFAKVIQRVKDGMTNADSKNSESRDQVEVWKKILAPIESTATAEELNKLFPKAAETKNKTISAMMAAAAKKSGLKFNKSTKQFEAVPA